MGQRCIRDLANGSGRAGLVAEMYSIEPGWQSAGQLGACGHPRQMFPYNLPRLVTPVMRIGQCEQSSDAAMWGEPHQQEPTHGLTYRYYLPSLGNGLIDQPIESTAR